MLPLASAKLIANRLIKEFSPFCERIQIAGSIRREVPEVKDIELVCIPAMIEDKHIDPVIGNVGETWTRPNVEFCRIVNSYDKVKGECDGKYTQRIIPYDGGTINLDLFMANRNNWGYILAIRTGSAHYSKSLAQRWVSLGYKGVDGYLTRKSTGERIALPEEHTLFNLLGAKMILPQQRK